MLATGDTDPELTAKETVANWNNTNGLTPITKTITTDTKASSYLLNFGYQILSRIYDELGIPTVIGQYAKAHRFKFNPDQVLKLLVIGRMLEPASKSRTIADFQETLTGAWALSQNDMDRSLDHFGTKELKTDIQLAIHKNISKLTNRTATLVFYDVTNYYFESDLGDPDILMDGSSTLLNKTLQKKQGISPSGVVERGMRKRGASKEYRRDPIVQLGLFMDSNGIPIAYQIFPGNESDPLTYQPAIEQVKQQFGLERIVTVADKAMNSESNVSASKKRGDGWLFSQKVRGKKGVPKDIQEFALARSDWEFNSDMSIAKKSMIRTREIGKGANTTQVQEKVLVTWRRSYAVREKIRRDGALDYAAALTNPEKFRRTMRRGGKKYLKMTLKDTKTGEVVEACPQLDVDHELADFDAQFDGMNVIATSEINMSDDEIMRSYGQLHKIEDCFRVTKTTLKTRPVFVWTKPHIEAHFLTCFIALVILRFLQFRLRNQYSPERIVEALRSLTGQNWAGGYWEIFANDDAKGIMNELGCNLSNKLQSVELVHHLDRRIML